MSIHTSSDYEERGKRLLHAGRLDEALSILQEGERKFPGDPDLQFGTAMVHLRLGALNEAGRILEDLRHRRPTGETLQALALCYLERGMIRQAVDAAVAAVNGAGRDVELICALGRAFYERRRCQTALPFYERAVEICPTSSEAWFGLGACRWSLKQAPGAVEALRRAVTLDSSDWQAVQFLGCVLADSGQKDEARRLLESVPLDAQWQRPALERLVALAWWPADPEKRRQLEEAWRLSKSA